MSVCLSVSLSLFVIPCQISIHFVCEFIVNVKCFYHIHFLDPLNLCCASFKKKKPNRRVNRTKSKIQNKKNRKKQNRKIERKNPKWNKITNPVLSCHSSPLSGYMEDWWRPRKGTTNHSYKKPPIKFRQHTNHQHYGNQIRYEMLQFSFRFI